MARRRNEAVSAAIQRVEADAASRDAARFDVRGSVRQNLVVAGRVPAECALWQHQQALCAGPRSEGDPRRLALDWLRIAHCRTLPSSARPIGGLRRRQFHAGSGAGVDEGAGEARSTRSRAVKRRAARGWGPCFLPSVLAVAWRESEKERREGERKEEREERELRGPSRRGTRGRRPRCRAWCCCGWRNAGCS